ncbi:MAG TPA: thiamine pyrophosphate-dependent enzyme [Planctomycetota bacterium]|nr:thiamine pyrophosphate-dependent enzyme [Planctomycetota bacterium]
MNAADILVETILDWGVDTVFGIPGDGINGIMEALRKRQDRIRFIQVRHEESAAFMACAHAKYTGRLGVCLGTSGPGGLHLLNGLYDAKMDGQPVLAITGHHYHDLIDTYAQQDVNLDRVFMDVAEYNTRIMGPDHVENVADLACRIALSRRGVAHITFPSDLQEKEPAQQSRSKRNIPGHTSDIMTRRPVVPADGDLNCAAHVLNGGQKIAILAGRGALGCASELLELSEKLSAPIVKPLLGKAVVPDDDPHTTGGIGLLGTLPSQNVMERCDTLLMVGTSFPYIEYLPAPGQAKAVQIDLDPARIGLRYPVDVGLVGGSRQTLQALLPRLQAKSDRSFLEQAQREMQEWNTRMAEYENCTDKPMKPQRVTAELSKRLPENAIISVDSGANTVWSARHIRIKPGQMYSCSGTLASMACALPYAIAAAIAHPDRPSIAFVGDGGFAMLMAELATCVKYDLPVKVVVLKNNSLGMIKFEQMYMEGNLEYGCELQPIDFVKVAEACGASALRIDDPAHCGSKIDEALSARGPVVIEAVIDPLELPMPPKIEAQEAYRITRAIARGEPQQQKAALTAMAQKVKQSV